MKGFHTAIAVLLMTAGMFASCKEKPTDNPLVESTVEITLEPRYGTQAIQFDETVFHTEEGYAVKLREMKLIVTNLRNGSNLLSDAASYDSKKGVFLLQQKGTASNFGQLQFSIGVDSTRNHADPSGFPNEHPLNILNAGDMHWSWNPGYIFFKLEMIADTANTGNFNHAISFHVGMDECFRETSFTALNWQIVAPQTERLRLQLDLKTLLRNQTSVVDLKTEFLTHSSPEQIPLSLKLADNFKVALKPY